MNRQTGRPAARFATETERRRGVHDQYGAAYGDGPGHAVLPAVPAEAVAE